MKKIFLLIIILTMSVGLTGCYEYANDNPLEETDTFGPPEGIENFDEYLETVTANYTVNETSSVNNTETTTSFLVYNNIIKDVEEEVLMDSIYELPYIYYLEHDGEWLMQYKDVLLHDIDYDVTTFKFSDFSYNEIDEIYEYNNTLQGKVNVTNLYVKYIEKNGTQAGYYEFNYKVGFTNKKVNYDFYYSYNEEVLVVPDEAKLVVPNNNSTSAADKYIEKSTYNYFETPTHYIARDLMFVDSPSGTDNLSWGNVGLHYEGYSYVETQVKNNSLVKTRASIYSYDENNASIYLRNDSSVSDDGKFENNGYELNMFSVDSIAQNYSEMFMNSAYLGNYKDGKFNLADHDSSYLNTEYSRFKYYRENEFQFYIDVAYYTDSSGIVVLSTYENYSFTSPPKINCSNEDKEDNFILYFDFGFTRQSETIPSTAIYYNSLYYSCANDKTKFLNTLVQRKSTFRKYSDTYIFSDDDLTKYNIIR